MDFPLSWILRSPSVSGRLAGFLDAGAGSFALRTCPHFRHVLTRSSRVDAATQHGAFPLRSTFWIRPASPLVRRRSGAFCSDPVPEYLAPIRLLAPLRSEFRLRLYPSLPSEASGRALRCLFLALSSASVALFQPYLPDGRYQASLGYWRSSPPCRPHTPWCDGVEPMCLRPHSAGSTIPRLRPTGSSLEIAPVDYDPVVLLKPFGPRLATGALPSRASSMVAPGRPIRVPAFAVVPHEPLHTFHPLWPVRHYPHLRISVRGPGPSGTSTHLTRQLPGTHYEGATTSQPRTPGASGRGRCPPGPPGFVLAEAPPGGWRSRPSLGRLVRRRPGSGWRPRGRGGISQVPWRSIPCLCPAPRPRLCPAPR